MACCDREKTRGPNTSGVMVCPIHCSKCGHDNSMAKETMRKRRLILLMGELDLRTS